MAPPFTFVHTADWQIGKPFRGFGERVAGVLEDARLTAIDRLADVARGAGARHVLVAGDVYDAELLPERTIRQPLEKMRSHRDLTWHLISGNHDPMRVGSLWTRMATANVPTNVLPHLSAVAAEIEPGVHLLPAPLAARSQSHDPTAWMDAVQTPQGALRIGLAHGSVQNFGEDGEAKIPISAERAKSARLDYLALGDWHGAVEINSRTWYSGTPEPDRFKDNVSGHALVVTLSHAGGPPQVHAVPTARFAWIEIDRVIMSNGDLASIESRLERLGRPLDTLLVRMVLTGAVDIETRANIQQWARDLQSRLRFLDLDLSALIATVAAADIAGLTGGGVLARAAEALRLKAASATGEEAMIAQSALMRLMLLARSQEGSDLS